MSEFLGPERSDGELDYLEYKLDYPLIGPNPLLQNLTGITGMRKEFSECFVLSFCVAFIISSNWDITPPILIP